MLRTLHKAAAAFVLLAGMTVLSPSVARAEEADCFENAHKVNSPEAFGLTWFSTRLLDVNEYLGCFKPTVPPNGYGPVVGTMAVLGSDGAWVQKGPSAEAFTLESLTVGSGWNTGATLTFEGFLNGVSQGVRTETLIAGEEIMFDFSGFTNMTFTHFTLWADYSQASDPFNSAALQVAAGGPDEPYKTFYIVGTTTTAVPEPATMGLLATGLIGLAGVARRRRSTT